LKPKTEILVKKAKFIVFNSERVSNLVKSQNLVPFTKHQIFFLLKLQQKLKFS